VADAVLVGDAVAVVVDEALLAAARVDAVELWVRV